MQRSKTNCIASERERLNSQLQRLAVAERRLVEDARVIDAAGADGLKLQRLACQIADYYHQLGDAERAMAAELERVS